MDKNEIEIWDLSDNSSGVLTMGEDTEIMQSIQVKNLDTSQLIELHKFFRKERDFTKDELTKTETLCFEGLDLNKKFLTNDNEKIIYCVHKKTIPLIRKELLKRIRNDISPVI